MLQIEINRIGRDDLPRLQEISRRTFVETFAADNSPENMGHYLDEQLSLSQLGAELANEGSRFYFASLDGDVIGYLKLNTGQAQTEPLGDAAMEIERIYVLKEYHGRKVAQALYDHGLDVAKELNVEQVWLGVWEQNPRAIAFYRKNGFEEFGKHHFQLGDDDQVDILMRLKVVKGYFK
jgi:ribosomal protein S18 acetylase RimI-like enzyme